MKYIRKIAVLFICVIMLASVAIGVGVIFAVRNVNVTMYSYTCKTDNEAQAKIAEFKNAILKNVKGKLISSVTEEKVKSALSDGNYFYVAEFKKVYPCTLNVTIKEHKEVFYCADVGGAYTVYDESGSPLRVAENEEAAINPDGIPNLLVEGAAPADMLQYYAKLAAACTAFENAFGSLRSVCEKAVLSIGAINDGISFYLRCGVRLTVLDFGFYANEKISAGLACFNGLSADKKQCGEIYCYRTAEGTVSSTYR